ncbi:MAG TPA: cobalamin-dependent protein, partial [Planctomycetota bacterium]|nr:cobalamin-dependent protein [Planctomycetota bacterium]
MSPAAIDMAFIHPPASFRKRERPFAGVFPAETGTDSWFRHAPLGLSVMAQRLRAAGYEARILNLAKACSSATAAGRPLSDAAIEARLRALPARAYGISLHWAVHAPGALDLVALLRRIHPDAAIVLGGLTASYFAEEALELAPDLD